MARSTKYGLAGLALALALGQARLGHAVAAPRESPRAEAESASTPIYVVGAGPGSGISELIETARRQLLDQGVTMELVEPAPGETMAARARALVDEQGARGVFWIDQSRPAELRVYLLDARGAAFVRRVPVESGGEEASREAVWLIVESGSLALASGERVAMDEAELEPDPEPESDPAASPTPERDVELEPTAPEDTAPPPSRGRVRVSVAYLGSGLAAAVPWSSGAALDASLDVGDRWRVSAGYGLLLPWRAGEPVVTWRHRAEVRAGPHFDVAPRVELYALGGGGLEWLRWREPAGDGGGWRVTGFGFVDGGLEVSLVANLSVVLEPGVALVFNRFDFVECALGVLGCEGPRRQVQLSPWRVRPRARVGLALRF